MRMKKGKSTIIQQLIIAAMMIILMIAIGIYIIYFIRYMVNRNKDFSVKKEIA